MYVKYTLISLRILKILSPKQNLFICFLHIVELQIFHFHWMINKFAEYKLASKLLHAYKLKGT